MAGQVRPMVIGESIGVTPFRRAPVQSRIAVTPVSDFQISFNVPDSAHHAALCMVRCVRHIYAKKISASCQRTLVTSKNDHANCDHFEQ